MPNVGLYGSNIVNAEWWKDSIQDYLRNMLVSTEICNTKCEDLLVSGNTVHFPQVSDVRVQDYTPGVDAIIDPLTATDSTLVVNKSKIVTFSVDPIEVKQATSKYVPQVTFQASYDLKNVIDQDVIGNAITSASTTTNAGSVTTSTVLDLFNDRYAQLAYNNATDGEMFAVIDPFRQQLLTQTFVANGFVEADLTLRNQFRGRAAGFEVYVSNNLPNSVSLTMDTNPTAGDTLTIYGAVFTFVAALTGTAGQVLIAGAVAGTQSNLRDAINNVVANVGVTFEQLSTDNRRNLQNRQVAISTFVANLATITGYGKIFQSETFTAVTNVFGTATTKLLWGRKGAPSLAIQMRPELFIHPIEAQPGMNYMTIALYGNAVFSQDTKRLTTAVINA